MIGRRRLRMELRRLRADREVTQEQVAAAMEWSLSKLIRIENGAVTISVSDLRSLLHFYELREGHELERLLELARAAKRRAWFDEYRQELAASLLSYVGLEAEATEIKYYHPIAIPGLLQTERYTRAMLTSMADKPDEKQINRQVHFRLRRQ